MTNVLDDLLNNINKIKNTSILSLKSNKKKSVLNNIIKVSLNKNILNLNINFKIAGLYSKSIFTLIEQHFIII